MLVNIITIDTIIIGGFQLIFPLSLPSACPSNHHSLASDSSLRTTLALG